MKKIAAIFLFLVMLLCGSGFYISWYISVQCIYNTQRNLISSATYKKQNVVAFTFPLSEIRNNSAIVLDNDELEYHGDMFDIINIKKTGDSIYINCIADRDEDNLKQLIASQMFSSTNDIGKQLPIAHFHLDNYIRPKHLFDVNCINQLICNYYISLTSPIPPDHYSSCPSPPPWIIA